MMWFLVILFAVISITLLSGRGAFLIAGYNTAGKARKMRYDEKKLCRIMGAGIGIITILLVILAASGDNPPAWLTRAFPVVVLLTVAVMIVLGNTVCKVKGLEPVEETAEEKNRNKKIERVSWIFCAVIFLLAGIFLTVGDINVTVNQDNIKMDGFFWNDYTVKMQDIQTVSFADDLDAGRRTSGFGSFKLLQGNFKNSSFGNYTLYAYTKCKSYVVLETSKGIVMINARTGEETKALYEEIKAAASTVQP